MGSASDEALVLLWFDSSGEIVADGCAVVGVALIGVGLEDVLDAARHVFPRPEAEISSLRWFRLSTAGEKGEA